MNEKKVKSAILRYKSRKYPIISFIYDDNSEKAITVKADLETAKKLLLKIKREIALGEFDINNYLSLVGTTSKGLTLNDFYNRYLDYRERLVRIDQISEATYQHDRFALDLLLGRLDKYTTLRGLSKDDMINFLVLLKDAPNKNGKPYKPGAINSYLKHIKAAFNWAVKEKLIQESPFTDVGMLPNPNDGVYRFISEDDIEKIRAYLKNKPEWQLDIFNLCLWTGARRDEVFNITKQSLYVDTIKGEKVPFAKLLGKGKKFRNMPLCVEACELLDRRVKYLTDPVRQFELKDRSKSPTQQCGVIDSRLKQGYLFWEITDSHSITKAFARTRKALGLDYFNVHSLRHSFATYCLKDNIRITTVKEFLGHTDIKTTMIYAKTDDELKAEDIKKHKPR
ncbi:tyrosine-type recombinase/integrase [candidate division KSB1 bacterium]|nr:tyrosine-type recombinase/integrase [candidate division KSB1 bacterium]MBL7094869.1 tyrosine-type recombinase/integrase [candidate division KSB1 bacterium]